MTLHLPRRPAYTLIELLVAVSLIIVLATLTVAVANSSLVDSYRIVGGADRLSGWLLQAKQRAVRDGVPVGVRLVRGSTNSADPEFYLCRQAQIVEMPVIYTPNIDSNYNNLNMPPNASAATAPFIAIRYTNRTLNTNPPNPVQMNCLDQENSGTEAGVYLYWPTPSVSNSFPAFRPYTTTDNGGTDLFPGDLLRIGELNSVHRVTRIDQVSPAPTPATFGLPSWFSTSLVKFGTVYKLTLQLSNVTLAANQNFPPSPPYPTNLLPGGHASPNIPVAGGTYGYPTGYPAIGGANYYQSAYFGLYRGSRPILGEPLLELPANMAVDVYPTLDVAPPGLANNILSPSQNIPVSQAGELEVIFNPNGSVLFSTDGQIIFWLRDVRNGGGLEPLAMSSTPTAPNPIVPAIPDFFINRAQLMNSGEHVLVSINAKTGAIGTYPVYPPDQTGRYDGRLISSGGDGGLAGPYKYALTASNTGL